MKSRWPVLGFATVLGVNLFSISMAGETDGPRVDVTQVLDRSFSLQYSHDIARAVRLVQADSEGQERITRLHMAQKDIDGRVHSLTRFLQPDSLRGMRILSIEADGRTDDHFIFLKSQQRVRRIRTSRRDAFLGTDFSMEDMEKRSANDFELTKLPDVVWEGERAYRIHARPLYESGYDHLEYIVAMRDYSNLAILYFKKDTESPFKELRVPRSEIERFDDVLIGRHAFVRHFSRRTETHVYLEKVVLDLDMDDALFSSTSLDTNRKIPGL